ncbi:putative zinc finger protein [Orchesella cincta]|uniref:Putative zinc finger protein n=1 Tax=Orchesella cincta TaxID=48709 RepID=A0A1D2MYB9_ORCCI|nr:putative zinc finger protein [Orchesella cincta]
MRIQWNNCFLCLNELKPRSSSLGGEKRGWRNPGSLKKLLFKYLLETCNRSCDLVLQDILQLMTSDDEDGWLSTASSPVQLCGKCEETAVQISRLHQELEVIQMKLADTIKSVREVVICNSKAFGENEVAKMCLNVFEDWLNNQEKVGESNQNDKKILEVLYAFQTAVYETGKESYDIPLVFVKKISCKVLPTLQPLALSNNLKMEPTDIDFDEDKASPVTETLPIDDDDYNWYSSVTPCSLDDPIESNMEVCSVADSVNAKGGTTSSEARRTPRKSARLMSPKVKGQRKQASQQPTPLKIITDGKESKPKRARAASKSDAFKTMKDKPESEKWRVKNIASWARDTNRVLPSTNTYNEITTTKYKNLQSKSSEKNKKIRGPYKKKQKEPKERSRFECELCSYKIKNIYRFEKHLRDHESEEKGYTCEECQMRFSVKQHYEFHQECHAGKHKILCEFCNLKISPLTIVDHMKTHAEKVFPCNNCSYCCITRDKLIEHLRIHCSSIINCDVCSVPIRTRLKLLEHLHNEHGVIEKFQCNVGSCTKSFLDPASLWVHKNVHNKQFPCHLCDKIFPDDAHRKVHLRYHNKDKQFSCDFFQCGERFLSKSNLDRHKISQHGAPKHKCGYCQKEYADRTHYLAHVRLHEGGGINCKICNKSFGSASDLRRHSGVHQEERNFVCDECGKAFRRRESLKKHKMIHVGDKKYKCDHCPKAFVFQKYLVQHLRIHTGERPFIYATWF